MKIDAHYYALLAFCRALGFKKEPAHEVAYASQYVDDAKINQVTLRKVPDNIEYDLVKGEPGFINTATSHSYFQLAGFNLEAMLNNTAAFHFVPGCRGGSFPHRMRCRQAGPVISEIMERVIEEGEPVALGVWGWYLSATTRQKTGESPDLSGCLFPRKET